MTFIIIIRYPIVLFADMFNVIICFNNYEMVQGDIKLMKKLDRTPLDSQFHGQEYYLVRFLT